MFSFHSRPDFRPVIVEISINSSIPINSTLSAYLASWWTVKQLALLPHWSGLEPKLRWSGTNEDGECFSFHHRPSSRPDSVDSFQNFRRLLLLAVYLVLLLAHSIQSLLLPQKWLDRYKTCTRWSPDGPASRVCSRSRSRSKVTWYGHFSAYTKIASSTTNMTRSSPNLHTMVPRRACIQDVLKVKVKVKGHVIRTLL